MENVQVQQLSQKIEELQKKLQSSIQEPIKQLKDSIQQRIDKIQKFNLQQKPNITVISTPRNINTTKQIFIKFKPRINKKTRLMQVCLDYPQTNYPLNCITDGLNIASLAKSAGIKDILQVFDNNTTRYYPNKQGTLTAFIQFCKGCQSGDFLVFQYSGHGATQKDTNGDQPDKQDEQLILISKNGKQFQRVTDDDISNIVCKYLPMGVLCLFIIDACHSKTMLDLQNPNYKGRSIVCISGCMDNETSNDSPAGGFMTLALLQVLTSPEVIQKRSRGELSVQYVYNRMVPIMEKKQQNYPLNQKQHITITTNNGIQPQNVLFPII